MIYDDETFDTPLHGDENGVVTCYMDKVVWDYEVGGDLAGSEVYPTEEAVFLYRGHGLVEVEIRLKRVIQDNDFKEAAKDALTSQQVREDLKARKEDPEWQEYMRLREKFDTRWRHFKSLQGKRKFMCDKYGEAKRERREDQKDAGGPRPEGKVSND